MGDPLLFHDCMKPFLDIYSIELMTKKMYAASMSSVAFAGTKNGISKQSTWPNCPKRSRLVSCLTLYLAQRPVIPYLHVSSSAFWSGLNQTKQIQCGGEGI